MIKAISSLIFTGKTIDKTNYQPTKLPKKTNQQCLITLKYF